MYNALCKRADLREAELIGKAGKEGELERHLERSRARLKVAELQADEVREELAKAEREIEAAEQQLAHAERAAKGKVAA